MLPKFLSFRLSLLWLTFFWFLVFEFSWCSRSKIICTCYIFIS